MILNKHTESFVKLGNLLQAGSADLDNVLSKTEIHNPWFTDFHSRLMLRSFIDQFFNKEKMGTWLQRYDFPPTRNVKTIGLVLAGNVPFAGMHDLLCVLVSGNRAQVKLSSKDQFFFPYLHQLLSSIDPYFSDKVEFTERLAGFDAVIATGSNNSARYFEYYFGKYPHIIRKNRTSAAILNGAETEDELHELGKDVFYYYGLGCRNVGKVFLPEGFEPEKLFRIWEDFRYVNDNTKYKNNYDYNRTLLLLNQTPHLANDFFMMTESPALFSPLATLHYEFYTAAETLQQTINTVGDDLQCIVAAGAGNTGYGKTQFPELWDYADHIDTMEFLHAL